MPRSSAKIIECVGEYTITDKSVTWKFYKGFEPFSIDGRPRHPHIFFKCDWPSYIEVKWTRDGQFWNCYHKGTHKMFKLSDGDHAIDHECELDWKNAFIDT